jgi:hypothetical protein
MAVMLVEDWGELPLPQSDARDRLPSVMGYMGYRRLDEETWKRRRDRCRSGWWSLPDVCPAVIRWKLTEVEAPEDSKEEPPRTRYAVSCRVHMPGQILANTDAKALELEIDRMTHLLIGGFDRDVREERAYLTRLTLMSNVLLSLIPACGMLLVLWMTRRLFVSSPLLTSLLWIIGLGGVAWGIGMWATARWVVRLLNGRVETRVTYRSERGMSGGFARVTRGRGRVRRAAEAQAPARFIPPVEK